MINVINWVDCIPAVVPNIVYKSISNVDSLVYVTEES